MPRAYYHIIFIDIILSNESKIDKSKSADFYAQSTLLSGHIDDSWKENNEIFPERKNEMQRSAA